MRTDIPARLDRLPWSRFHGLIVVALGITWVLDGLEVTLVGSIGPLLQDHRALGLTAAEIGAAASIYVAGAVVGALGFGWLTDRRGRRLVFNLTLAIYLVGVLGTAGAWSFGSFAMARALTGLAIGGEYSAINSAIDELIPARLRGRVDLMVNGTYWLGAGLGAAASLVLADGHTVSVGFGWRLGFLAGGVLGLLVLGLRQFVPESPRWLVTHARDADAERSMAAIEARVAAASGVPLSAPEWTIEVQPQRSFGVGLVLRTMLGPYRMRSLLVLVLMAAQAFLYNAIFFTYGLVLTRFDHVPAARIGLFVLPLAAGNFLGPVLLGGLFDSWGRRRMVTVTYALAGVLLLATSAAFSRGVLDGTTQTLCWVAVFFFASAAASAAYLTASEVFPLETRGLAIAVFYALGTAIGGVAAPYVFSRLIESGQVALAVGYAAAAALMLAAAAVEWRLGIDAEGQSLERISPPLSTGY